MNIFLIVIMMGMGWSLFSYGAKEIITYQQKEYIEFQGWKRCCIEFGYWLAHFLINSFIMGAGFSVVIFMIGRLIGRLI